MNIGWCAAWADGHFGDICIVIVYSVFFYRKHIMRCIPIYFLSILHLLLFSNTIIVDLCILCLQCAIHVQVHVHVFSNIHVVSVTYILVLTEL